MATGKKKGHSEREAEIAKKLGLSYTKDLPSSAKNSGTDGTNLKFKNGGNARGKSRNKKK